MQVRRVRVQVDTQRLRISGVLQLPIEGYRSRTTDFLNAHETGFIALTDAEIAPYTGGAADRRPFVAVGCRHIEALVELEDLGVAEEDATPSVPLAEASTPPPGATS